MRPYIRISEWIDLAAIPRRAWVRQAVPHSPSSTLIGSGKQQKRRRHENHVPDEYENLVTHDVFEVELGD